MLFTQQDLHHLARLSRIQFADPNQEAYFLATMQTVVSMLSQLDSLDVAVVDDLAIFMDKTMHVSQGQKDFDRSQSLLANVEHPLMNNCIAIQSVFANDT